MRADRLLRLLLVLQRHRRVTAAWLADELEVSERTVLRDMEALSAAGVPVYTERGRGGGCVLMEGFTTDATGLTAAEAQALFAWAGRESTAELGLHHDLAGALAKVAATAPRRHAARSRAPSRWGRWSSPTAADGFSAPTMSRTCPPCARRWSTADGSGSATRAPVTPRRAGARSIPSGWSTTPDGGTWWPSTVVGSAPTGCHGSPTSTSCATRAPH